MSKASDIYHPTPKEVERYVESLFKERDKLNLDSVFHERFCELLESGIVPFYSCQGHELSDVAYISFYYDTSMAFNIDVVVKEILNGRLGEYEGLHNGEPYETSASHLEIGLSENAKSFNPNCEPYDRVVTLTLRWSPYGMYVEEANKAIDILIKACSVKSGE